MKNIVEVRNLKLGEGMPKICVPIVGKTKDEIMNEAEYLKELTLDLLEWRVDCYENVTDIEKVKEVLKELREEVKNLPIIFTFRSIKEGGEKDVSTEFYAELNKEIAKTKMVDLIDVELFTGDETVKSVVNIAHKNGVKVVMSNHDFNKTPEKEEIIERLIRMQELDADIPKIAVMPQNSSDVLKLLCATDEMSTKYADRPIITMSMSGLGVVSRIAGEVFGSALTFGAAKKTSAPGQISAEKLSGVLEIMHESKE